MKFDGFEILDFTFGIKAGFYTIKLEGEKKTEAEKFFAKYGKTNLKNIRNIVKNINTMKNKRGCLEHLFKKEFENIYKLWDGKLRLYCIRFGNSAAILGGGDFKDVRATQDSETLSKHVELLKHIDEEIYKRISNKEIIVTDNRLLEI